MTCRAGLVGIAVVLCSSAAARAQQPLPAPLDSIQIPIAVDSGAVSNESGAAEVVFATVVKVADAPWLRLSFEKAELSGDSALGSGAYLRLTALRDGALQTLDANGLRRWSDTSAYFNGDAVLVELVAHGGTGVNRLVMSEVTAGVTLPSVDASICGNTDDRQLSSDPRVGRLLPVGCTAWLVDDCNHCVLTAGHCMTGTDFSNYVLEFNVPLSNAEGTIVMSAPEDQYPVANGSVQSNGGQGVGQDWAYFGVQPNENTGLMPFEAQGAVFALAPQAPAPAGQQIRITGNGSVAPPTPLEWNLVQKTHTGPYVSLSGTELRYRTDTTGGNSGSPVIDESTGQAIGIHTHGGCNAFGGQNAGTAIQHAALQSAIGLPQGACGLTPIDFSFPSGIPATLDAGGGGTIRVQVAAAGATPLPGTGLLYYDAGGGLTSVAMQPVSDNVYDAVFPALDCGSLVTFYFSAQTIAGDEYFTPGACEPPPLSAAYVALAADSSHVLLSDNFQAPAGWTVGEPGDDATTGIWTRSNPQGTYAGETFVQPENDHTPGSGGHCWITEGAAGSNSGSNDVDGGTTTLTSAVFNLSGEPEARISYWRWYSNDSGAAPSDDLFRIDINDGSGWINVETVGPAGVEASGGWFFHMFRVADFVAPNATVQLRFVASDLGAGSIVEAALDDFQILTLDCGAACIGDVNGDGVIDLADLATLLANFGATADATPADGDLDGDGDVDLADLAALLAVFGTTCP